MLYTIKVTVNHQNKKQKCALTITPTCADCVPIEAEKSDRFLLPMVRYLNDIRLWQKSEYTEI